MILFVKIFQNISKNFNNYYRQSSSSNSFKMPPKARLKWKTYKPNFVEPTAPLPPITTRGKVRKNRLYCPEENIQRALELIRQGVYMSRAATIADVPLKRLNGRVNALRNNGELEMYWGKNAPGFKAALEAEAAGDSAEPDDDAKKGTGNDAPSTTSSETVETGGNDAPKGSGHVSDSSSNKQGGTRIHRKRASWPKYSDAELEAAVSAVRQGLYTVNHAKNIFKVQ